MGTAVGIGIGIGRKRKNWSSYWTTQSLYKFIRSGLSLIDSIGGNNGSIITSAVYLTGAASYYINTPVVLNIADGFHISGSYQYKANLATNIARIIMSFRATGSDTAEGVWQLYLTTGNKFEFFYRANGAYRQLTTNITPVDGTWYDYDVHITGGKVVFTLNGSVLNPDLVAPTSVPAGKIVVIGATAAGASLSAGYHTNIYLGSSSTYSRYPMMEHTRQVCYDTGPNALHALIVKVGNFGAYVNTKCSHILDKGFALWSKANNPDIIVPFTDQGVEIVPADGLSILTGYAKSYSRIGSLDNINMSPCILRLPNNEITDRSDTDSFSDACRAATDYDVNNINDFHISGISSVATLASYLNNNFKGRIFPFVVTQWNGGSYDVIRMDGIVILKTDKKGNEEGKIMTNTGNKVFALLDNGSYMYDDDNYVILNS